MILIRYDAATTFQTYIDVNNFVREVYDGLHNDLSEKVFGKSFATLSEAEARIIRKAVPMNVCETDLSYARYKLPSSEVVSRYYYCRDSLAE